MTNAAVGVSRVAEPSGHSRDGHLSAENPRHFDLPRHGLDKRPRHSWPIEIVATVVDQDGLAIIRQDIVLLHEIAPLAMSDPFTIRIFVPDGDPAHDVFAVAHTVYRALDR